MKILPIVALCGCAAAAGLWVWHAAVTEPATSPAAPISLPDYPQTTGPGGGAAGTDHDSITAIAGEEPDCAIVRHYLPKPDGTSVEAVSCERDSVAESHPYTHYPNAALESLAYSDAKAAQILGMRLIEADAAASLSLVVRAAALSGGDPAPVLLYSNAYPHPVFIDGVPQRKTVHVKYVLAAVADLLDGDTSAPNMWEPVIREHSADPDRELAELHARARQIVAEMRRIQTDVSGTSTIGGPGDA